MVIGRGVLVENTPRKLPKGLLRMLRNFRLRMRTPKGTTKGSSGHVATVLLRKKTGVRRTYFRQHHRKCDLSCPHILLLLDKLHQEMQSVKHNLIPLSETIFSIHKICTLHIRLNNAYYFSTKRLNVRVKVFWTFLEGTYFKILQARRLTYPSVTKLHKSTQLLTPSFIHGILSINLVYLTKLSAYNTCNVENYGNVESQREVWSKCR